MLLHALGSGARYASRVIDLARAASLVAFAALAPGCARPIAVRVEPAPEAIVEPPAIEFRPAESKVHCRPADAWLALPPGAWRVASSDATRLLLVTDEPPRRSVLVVASAGLGHDDPAVAGLGHDESAVAGLGHDDSAVAGRDRALAEDWATALAPLVRPGASVDRGSGSIDEHAASNGARVSGELRFEPDDGASYRLAYRSVSRAASACRVTAFAALTAADGNVGAARARSLERSVLAVEARDPFVDTPTAARLGDVGRTACVLEFVVVGLDRLGGGKSHPHSACNGSGSAP